MRKTITGAWSNESNIVAFCCFRRHKGYITKNQRKMHKCLKHGCKYYIPLKRMKSYQKDSKKEGE